MLNTPPPPPFDIPNNLKIFPNVKDKKEITEWEFGLTNCLSPQWKIFTPYEDYFEYRLNLFQMINDFLNANVFLKRQW
jgi:hypothetical protein